MSLPASVRSLIPLVIGLAVGGVGAASFLRSMPGEEGSPEERARHLENELKRAQNRIVTLEAANGPGRTPHGIVDALTGNSKESQDSRRAMSDRARRIAEDVRAGKPVSPDDIFWASQPLMRDLAPLFDRMRVKQQQQQIDIMTGELARKYNLPPERQARLKEWFERKAEDEAKRWNALIARDGTRLEDVMKASRNVRPDEGLDAFMPGILGGDELIAFQKERMGERAQRVEQQADMRVQQLDSVVGLDEAQRDQVFGIMARSSREYSPEMMLEGAHGPIAATAAGDPQAATLAVLRPDQRAAYDAEQQRRRESAQKDLEAMGMTLPANWNMFDNNDFN